MKLKQPENETITLFHNFMSEHNNDPSKDDLRQFVSVSNQLNVYCFFCCCCCKLLLVFIKYSYCCYEMQANFEKRGTEFDDWIPTDWIESPKYLDNIKDANFREFGKELNKLWKILGRKMKDEVAVRTTYI